MLLGPYRHAGMCLQRLFHVLLVGNGMSLLCMRVFWCLTVRDFMMLFSSSELMMLLVVEARSSIISFYHEKGTLQKYLTFGTKCSRQVSESIPCMPALLHLFV